MKKHFLSLLIALVACAGATFAQITPSLIYQGGGLEIAMDVTNSNTAEFLPVTYNKSGNDIEIVLLNNLLSVEKRFTLKDVLKNEDGEEPGYLENISISSVDTEDIVMTRNFFVKNDKWCIVVRLSEGNYSLIDEDGNKIGTFPTELLGMKGSYSYLGDIILSGFINGIPYYETEDENNTHYMYTFTGKNGIEPTLVSAFKSAYPNPLPAGEEFNVNLPQAADDATFFCVVDMKGRQVCRRKIDAGATSYTLRGSRFSHGHYVYTVVYGDGTTASGRLMAE